MTTNDYRKLAEEAQDYDLPRLQAAVDDLAEQVDDLTEELEFANQVIEALRRDLLKK